MIVQLFEVSIKSGEVQKEIVILQRPLDRQLLAVMSGQRNDSNMKFMRLKEVIGR
jgi:hypothetical protein